MTEAGFLLIGTALTVAATMFGTIWAQRRASPASQATLGGAYDSLLSQLQTRLVSLELRVVNQERELDAYHRMYGPPPVES